MLSSLDRFQPRQTNSQLLLRLIYDRGPVSRADLARASGLTAPTVSEIAAGLLLEGLVEEVGLGPSTGGKRPTLLRVVDDSRQLIGLDLARGDFRGALMNLRGEIRCRVDLALEGRSGDAALELACRLVELLAARAEHPLLGIGIGAPGLADAARGVVCASVNLGWHDLPLADLLQARAGLPVYLSNDCQVAALAEHLFGAGKPSPALAVINTGQGVGSGIVLNGQLLAGSPFGAGEIGHLVVDPGGERCSCGNLGCLETVVGLRGLARRAQRLGIDAVAVAAVNAVEDAVLLERLQRLSAQGDPAAVRLVQETGQALGIAAASLVGVLGGCRIQFAGSLVGFGKPLLDAVRSELARRAFAPVVAETEIGYVSAGADIVLRGASVLVLSREMRLL
jgi:predicted NBD/HSP70 family sugar kinase